MTCLLHSAKLSAMKLPYVDITVRSTDSESMESSINLLFSHLKLSNSNCKPKSEAPTRDKDWLQFYSGSYNT